MLGARIAALRREAGLSQTELAQELGISASAIGMYEQSRREPSAQMLVQLAKKFGVSVDYLLTGREPQHLQQLEQMLQHRIAEADLRLSQRKERPFSRDELAVLFAALLLHEQFRRLTLSCFWGMISPKEGS